MKLNPPVRPVATVLSEEPMLIMSLKLFILDGAVDLDEGTVLVPIKSDIRASLSLTRLHSHTMVSRD